MKKAIHFSLILLAVLLGFFYPKEYQFQLLIKLFSIAVIIYYVLQLSQKIKSKNQDNEPKI